VYPVNPALAEVEGLPAFPDLGGVPVERLDRVSLYVPPSVGLRILDAVAARPVGEVWLNPGTDSREVLARARELGLDVVRGCSILDIGRSPGDY
jgi:predicted CoA-binding protein